MRVFSIFLYLLVFVSISSLALFSHHAMEYIEMDSYTTAREREFVFHWHYDYIVDKKNDPQSDHYEITPGLSYGIIDRLMFDVHCHFAKFGASHLDEDYCDDHPDSPFLTDGPSPFIEAAAASFQYRVTEHNQIPIDLAIGVFGEIPTKRAKNLLGSERVYGGSLILSRGFGLHNNITTNFNYERDGDENIWSWAVGMKLVLSTVDDHAPAIGCEVIGDYEGHIGIMPGIYMNIMQNTIFKAGIFIGVSQYHKKSDVDFQEEREEDLRANVTVMTRW